MRTVAWSPRVGEVWTDLDGRDVEVTAEHTHARLVKLTGRDGETEWLPVAELEGRFSQSCCGECGVPLTMMRKLLVEESRRNAPKPEKSSRGTYCSKPCCWPPHAPPGC